MKLTDDVKNRIALTLQRKGKTKAELVRAVGMSPSWATNLFQPFEKGGLKELREEQVERIEEFLGEPLRPESEEGKKVLPVALRLSQLAENNEGLHQLLAVLLNLAEECQKAQTETLDARHA